MSSNKHFFDPEPFSTAPPEFEAIENSRRFDSFIIGTIFFSHSNSHSPLSGLNEFHTRRRKLNDPFQRRVPKSTNHLQRKLNHSQEVATGSIHEEVGCVSQGLVS